MPLLSYLSQDRRLALAEGPEGSLPERVQGTALIADIAGFTALTERLSQRSGERLGIEALSEQINAVYAALIAEVEAQQGSVIAFAGDAITCWFDAAQGAASARAAVAALGMQRAMAGFGGLSLRVGMASGAARRWVVGRDSQPPQWLDVLVGATVVRAATAENLAQTGEVLLAQASAVQLGLPKGAPREAPSGERFFLLEPGWTPNPAPAPSAPRPLPELPLALLRPWVQPFVFARELGGQDLFLSDLRPATALFLRFEGIDYDRDPGALAALDALVAQIRRAVEQQGGTVLELSVGDKGSYLYANFGAAQVHEDDAARAVRAALALREALGGTPHAVQIGLSCGTLRVGGYGGPTRQSFGALGDEVNAAARLMALAQPGELLISGRLRQQLGQEFRLEARPPVPLKGKAEPMPVFAVLGLATQAPIRLQERVQAQLMAGRAAELALLTRKLGIARQGQGQVLCFSGEPGIGKSRLVVEALGMAQRQQFIACGGACRQEDVPTPYRVWQPIWQALLDLDPSWPARRQRRALEARLQACAAAQAEAWPLLGGLLGIDWPDTPFTAALLPKDRKAALEALLQQCLGQLLREAEEDDAALLLVLEDVHAIDPLSADLLLQLASLSATGPLLLLLTHRPEPAPVLQGLLERLEELHHAERRTLGSLSAQEIEQVLRARLAALFPARLATVPPALLAGIAARAQGNPFFAEELLHDLHDRGLDPFDPASAAQLALPGSLHSLVLSRIDRLPLPQQRVLKVASVIGRLFPAADVQSYHAGMGEPAQVEADLQALEQQGFTPQAPDEARLSYLFRHLITQEAAYESMALAARHALHGEYASFLEATASGSAALLAQHFCRAELRGPACRYLKLAGEEAAARFANEDALRCFAQALAWLPAEAVDERLALLLHSEALLDVQGRHDARAETLDQLQALAERLEGSAAQCAGVWAQIALRRARLALDLGDYAQARRQASLPELPAAPDELPLPLQVDALLLQARALFYAGHAAEARPLLAQAQQLAEAGAYAAGHYNSLALLGVVHWQLGEFTQATALLQQALALIERAGDVRRQVDVLSNLGVVAKAQGQPAKALAFYAAARAQALRIGDRAGEAMLLTNMSNAELMAGDFVAAGAHAEQAAALYGALREPAQQGMAMLNGAEAQRELGQLDAAQAGAERALALLRRAGAERNEAILLENLGLLAAARGDSASAADWYAQALTRAEALDMRPLATSVRLNRAATALRRGDDTAAEADLAAAARQLRPDDDPMLGLRLQALRSELALARRQPAAALAALATPLDLVQHLLAADAGFLPMELFACALRTLATGADPRHAALRAHAQALLAQRAAALPEGAARQAFLALPDHQAIGAGSAA
ncbi:AAA family ATPase [Inhella proteolytica]|uniref:AAA family ATPase n=1 Tax=Inhella proteolytica TaxID=2795029 RepID=A0A931IYS5_9BURK|nr:adenylate/guanylate cyclase domain-containing protein [Inhella proteolytica]MBH9576249.1 AAA family ATPase [Inhella proteolytica]